MRAYRSTYPGRVTAPTVLPLRRMAAPEWRAVAAAHAERADALTAGRLARRSRGEKHPIDDFLYEYYALTPGLLRRWHPGVGTVLAPDDDGRSAETAPADDGEPEAASPLEPPHAAWRWYLTDDDGAVSFDVPAFLADRGRAVGDIHRLLSATASRPAFAGCFGLHEWAMAYRQPELRHALPLRLGQAGTDAVVEAHKIRCSHFDAFRFFTPDALARNQLQPSRENQAALEQPGCLHANMDLLKWAIKLGPAVPGELVMDCAELARDVRLLDMRASPYDVSSLGERAVAIETPEGKAEYVAGQRAFSERAAVLRERLIRVCEVLATVAP